LLVIPDTCDSAGVPGLRQSVPKLYDELWDALLDAQLLSLNVIIVDHALAKKSGATLVLNAGPKLHPRCYTAKDGKSFGSNMPKVVYLEDQLKEEISGTPYVLYDDLSQVLPQFNYVVMGGTFDHLHHGHKKLLTVAVSCMKPHGGTLVVGVTSDAMLQKKSDSDLIEPLEFRKAHVTRLVSFLAPNVRLQAVTITDPWGPAIVKENLQAIIVSTETLKGGRMINEMRVAKGLKPLVVIAVMRGNGFTLSSTFVRKQLKASNVVATD